MQNTTIFDPNGRYVFLTVIVTSHKGQRREIDALLDTGAPTTEFSDEALQHLGFLDELSRHVKPQRGMQTQKYGKVVIPRMEICSHVMENTKVFVSHFDKSWGIKALVGLDFFRQFKVMIDYSKGVLVTEPYPK